MKSIKKIASILACASMIALIFNGCTKKGEITKLKIAEVTHSVFYAPQYVAINEGFFEEEGLKVELIAAQGADKTMAALVSGEVQIGLMGPEASIYIYNQKSKDYAINFAQVTKRDGSFLVGREKEDNFKYENLKGKEVIGGRKGGVPEMTLEYVIKEKGLTIGQNTKNGEVNVRTDVQFNVMGGAFIAGEGDYVTLFEPAATAVEKDGKGYILSSIGEVSGEIPYTAYSATNTYIDKNPEVIQKFTNAIYKGQLYVQNHSAEDIAKSIAPFFTDIKMEDLIVVVNRYKSIDAWCQNPVLKEASLNSLMKVMSLAGELDKEAPYDKIVTTKYAEEAIKNIKE
ncbi:ABC transporter substrate-binding protein [Clostridium sp. MSJ-4]|uniref:ABC transporter substrate-binding protein n=1 Tax=Clostridium simiarum TaxID=2841506 RepID=A0ABS6EXV1_9CLOT|nr:ABC transporter substrate-binding protein [Clostridium simiarum]MBU5590182.1 ABC transporter substrate-binding protein [Clostridium simiarum]